MSPPPIRVLHCAAGNLYGGVETLLATLARARSSFPGLDSEFALCFEGRLANEIRDAGAAVHPLGAVRFSRPWTVWSARRRLGRLLQDRRIDVVVTHGCWAHLLAGPAAKKAHAPAVFWMHDMIGEGKPHWVDRDASKVVPDRVIVNSHATAETLPRLFNNVASEVIRYPVAPPEPFDKPEARRALRDELTTNQDDVVIVLTARLERWKGHAFLIDALGKLNGKTGWTAWIAGGTQRPHEAIYLEEIQTQAHHRRIENRLRFIGQRDDIPKILGAADIHCQPNLGPEPFGIAFVEALYAGLPVVSSNIGGAAEIVTDACGRLVPAGDVEALAQTLRTLIDDRNLRAGLGTAGPPRAAELCGLENVLPRIENYLGSSIASFHCEKVTRGGG